MIAFILGCILLGVVLSVLIAPIIAIRNQAALRQMRSILSQAENYPKNIGNDNYHEWRRSLIASLYDIKSRITLDSRSLTHADDIIERFKNLTV